MSPIARFKSLPRAMKWLVAFALFIGVYFAAIEPLVDLISRYNGEADKISADLARRHEVRETLSNTAGEFERSLIAFGRPALPAKSGDPTAALDRRLTQVLTSHEGVRETRRNAKEIAPVTSAKGGPGKYSRIAIELTFECDTAGLLAVLRDLERAPEVTAISRLTVRKINDPNPRNRTDSGLLQVQLSPETWVLTPAIVNGERTNP